MQLANIMLALGGDVGNTIPKYETTPAEVAVLQHIHGNEAVTDIDVLEKTIPRTSRAERERLLTIYGKPMPPRGDIRCEALEALFPGVAARVFETFDEMDLLDEHFKAKPKKAAPEPDEADDEEQEAVNYKKLNKAQLVALAEQRGVDVSEADKKDEIIAALEEADLAKADAAEDADDEIGEMPGQGGNLFK